MNGQWRAALVSLLLLACPAAARAAVTIQFYSHDLDKSFPHAFVILKGTIDATGEAVDTDIGFSAITVTPAILFRPTPGHVQFGVIPTDYLAVSQEHFSLVLTDAEYATVMETAKAWVDRAQPSYNLNSANCVFFIGAIAQALNLRGEPRKGLMKSPRSFLDRVRIDSQTILAARSAKPPAADFASPPPVLTASAPAEPELQTGGN